MTISIAANPRNAAAKQAIAIYAAVLESVRADRLVLSMLSRRGDTLHIGTDLDLPLAPFKHVYLVGAGKAAAAMAAAAAERLEPFLTEGVVVTKYGHAYEPTTESSMSATGSKIQHPESSPDPADARQSNTNHPKTKIRVLEAGHPMPDAGSVAAGRAIRELAERAGEDDLVLCLISGGASALMELPQDGLTLDDLRATTDLLLRAGAPIEDLNTVRACLSQLKAGGLARAAAPARLICLVLSDVLGNPLSVIGSGPCVETIVDAQAARQVLARYGLSDKVPPSILYHLDSTASAAQHSAPSAPHFILGDIWTALTAACTAAVEQGLKPCILTGWLEGEAREVARVFGGIARDLPRTRPETGIDCYIAGGETTVTVRGHGKGGRSQEIACAAAPLLAGIPDVALLAGGTDGTDGPTDAAGGLAETATMEQAEARGADWEAALGENDSYSFLGEAGGLLRTGPTHSNVGDVVIVVSAMS